MKEIHLDQNPYLNTEKTEQLIGKHVAKQNEGGNGKEKGSLASPFKNLANALNYAKTITDTGPKEAVLENKQIKSENEVRVQTEEESTNAKLIAKIREEWEKEEAKSVQKPDNKNPPNNIEQSN